MATTAPSVSSAAVGRRRWIALVFIALAQLMVTLDTTIVNIALPHAQRALHISDADRQWVVAAYTLAFGGLLLLGGRVADLLGRKRTFLAGLIGFAGCSALGGVAVNAGMLFGARALQGAFAALLAPSALSMLAVLFAEPRERAKAFGLWGAITAGGASVGLILGGVLTQYLSWRWSLYVNVPIAIIACTGAAIFVDRGLSARSRAWLDIPGVVLITGGLVSLVYGFTRAETGGWRDHITLGAFGAAVVLIVAFTVTEKLTTAPLLPPHIVLNRNRGGAYLANGLAISVLFGLYLFLTYYLQTVKDYSPVTTGLAFLPFTACSVISSTQIAARLMYRIAPRLLLVPAVLVAAVGVGLLTQLTTGSSFVQLVLPAEMLLGFGLGSTVTAAFNLGINGVSPTDAGVASAMATTSQQVGGSIGIALLNTIAAATTASYVKNHASGRHASALLANGEVHGFTVALWWGVGIMALAAVLVMVLVNARAQHGAGTEIRRHVTESKETPAPPPVP
jgi:EmrB/QacA subfamily drug resistance transporter